MAKVFGASGRYVADQARAKRLKSIIVGLISVALTAASAGFLFGLSVRDSKISPLVGNSIAIALLLGVLALSRWCLRRMDALEKERLHMLRGADGESSVARVLATFPDEFHVVHDITTPFGNIDHVEKGSVPQIRIFLSLENLLQRPLTPMSDRFTDLPPAWFLASAL